MPTADGDEIFGGVWMAGDGPVDPHIATHAVADAARALGAAAPAALLVRGIELGPDGEVRGGADRRRAGSSASTSASTPRGSERRRWRRWSAPFVPSIPGRPPARRDGAGRGRRGSAPRANPAPATLTTSSTARASPAACSVGGTKPTTTARWLDSGVRTVGSRIEPGALGHGPLRSAPGGRDPAFVARAGGRRAAALPPGRDDARQQPAAPGPMPGIRRVLGRRRASR